MNTRNLIQNLLLFAFFILASTCCIAQDEKEIIKETFSKYKAAVVNNKGKEAINYVDSRTLKYYNDLAEVVKYADSLKIDLLPIMDKIVILSVRQGATNEEIRNMNGTDLFVYAVKNGILGKGSVGYTIGDVSIDSNIAKGKLVIEEESTEAYLSFYIEQQKWKLDFTSVFYYMNIILKEVIESVGLSDNEYILMLLGNIRGKKPGSKIWQPVL